MALDQCAAHLYNTEALSDAVVDLLENLIGSGSAEVNRLERAKALVHLQQDELARALHALEPAR